MNIADLTAILLIIWAVVVGGVLVYLTLWPDRQHLSISNDVVESQELLARLQTINEEAQKGSQEGPK